MACSTCLCEWLLGILNVLIMLVGLTIAAIGAVLQAAAGSTFFKFLESTITDILKNVGVFGDKNNFVADMNFQEMFGSSAIILIVVGLVIACIAFLGWCGNCCGGYNVIRILYVTVLCIVLAAQIVVVALFFSKTFDSLIREQVINLINSQYEDLDSSDLTSIVMNVIMLQYKCCGLNDYGDFDSATKWNRTRSLKINGVNHVVNMTAPLACCATTGNFPEVTFIDDWCAVYPNETISNYKKGCWDAITSDWNQYRTIAILISSAVMVVQAFLVLFVIVIIRANTSKVSPV